MRLTLASAAALLALAGCGKPAELPEPAAPGVVLAMASTAATMAPATPPAAAAGRSVREENDRYEFAYSYPAQAGAIPALRAALDRRLDKARADLAAAAENDQASARKDGYPYRAHSRITGWKVVTDLPDWLSLSAELYGFSGGAHGMSNFDALLWDKRAGMARAPIDLFASASAFRAAVQAPFCRALDRERAKRRGPDYPKDDELFGKCIDPVDETTIILGSASGRGFDRIGFLIAPYSAGPYAEGSYEVTLPVGPALLRAVKPEYRAAFAPS
jgi:Deacetylase PdaC